MAEKIARMTDPMDGLRSLQTALAYNDVELLDCEIHPEIRVILDYPNKEPRITYVKMRDRKALAISIFVMAEPLEGLPCFNLGYAVAESERQQGLATEIVQKGLDEMKSGMIRSGVPKFYVEAVVGVTNLPSHKLALRLISEKPTPCTDCFSGEAALQYTKLITA